MTETAFLKGKLLKRSLPVYKGPPPQGADGPKRLALPQGELANFYDGMDGIRYLAAVELQLGGLRGNHYHKVKEEYVYVLSGELLLIAESEDRSERISVELKPGDLAWIAARVVHVMKPLAHGWAVEFSKTKFDPSDNHKVTLL